MLFLCCLSVFLQACRYLLVSVCVCMVFMHVIAFALYMRHQYLQKPHMLFRGENCISLFTGVSQLATLDPVTTVDSQLPPTSMGVFRLQ